MKQNLQHNQQVDRSIQLPLLELYKRVKALDEKTGHTGVDLGSYLKLLETIRKGYMMMSVDELLLLCEKLWIKPYHRYSTILNLAILRDLVNDAAMKIELPEDTLPPLPESIVKPPKKKRRSANDKNIPVKQDPPPPSETETELSKQKGEFSISVRAVNDTEGRTESISQPEVRFVDKNFLLKGHYLPISPRRIEQSIRLYRKRKDGLGTQEIDWENSIKEISKTRFFNDFIWRETDSFITQLTVFIDGSPSMAAFDHFAESIAEAVKSAALKKDATFEYDDIYYFINYPEDRLYDDKEQTVSVSLRDFAPNERKSIFIISDAGAAKGSYNNERIKKTYEFLKRLQKHQIAWLNPMPRSRWKNSSAEIISMFVNMFDIGEGQIDELRNVIRLFKSKIRTPQI